MKMSSKTINKSQILVSNSNSLNFGGESKSSMSDKASNDRKLEQRKQQYKPYRCVVANDDQF